MKTEFYIFNRSSYVKPLKLLLIFIPLITLAFILPFFAWFFGQNQLFSGNTFLSFIQYTIQHYPIDQFQEETVQPALLAFALYLSFLLIIPKVKLVITPEKIYYGLFKIPLITVVKRNEIEYSQLATIKLKLNAIDHFFFSRMNNPFNAKHQPNLIFFPLRQSQLSIHFELLNQTQRTQAIQLLKQYYNFKDESTEIILDKNALTALRRQEFNIKISTRVLYILICCIPIGALGMYLTATAPFFTITNYPTLLVYLGIFGSILIPSYIWIKKDIATLSFTCAAIASSIVTLSAYTLLLPILHGYYTLHYGEQMDYPATLIKIEADQQIWQSEFNNKSFFLKKTHPTYVPYPSTNTMHIFTVQHHWHNYVFTHDAYLNDKNKDQKKDR